ncbi:BppU family phage baseplate upper protein [Bacillus sp. 166amftsu]|uniref:BppU family phage baseplate upper protein n=1 Tax=Bacillus sp. 166amftsu TaxID=1761753 RepID=UPI00089BB135|nr:BppU family phage baseplate upper protein [Bacillus sp. 166amftsu]SDY42728.1 protein of unknown function [Bacillus sp. 166amftsu]
MRSKTLTIDIADPHFTKVITSRINDKNGLKLTVSLKDKGYPYNLSGYTIKYEAGNNLGSFIRDDCKIIDASNGVFEYTFSAAAVSANVWVAYFAFEKGEERFTTQDMKVLLSVDVKQGKIKMENYISDFDKALEAVAGYRKEIDATNAEIIKLKQQIAANNVQVPKITLDDGGQTISVSDVSKNILNEIVVKGKGMNTIYCATGVQGQTPNNKSWRGVSYLNSINHGFVWAKDYQGKFFTNYLDNGNWLGWVEHATTAQVDAGDAKQVSKTGDTMTGDLKTSGSAMFDSLGSGIIQGGGASSLRWRMYQSSNGECTFVPSATVGGSDWDFTKAFRIKPDGTIKQTSDTNWVPLTLLNGVQQQSTQPQSAVKRSGEVVCIECAITGFKNKQIIANIPELFRPGREMFFTCSYFVGLALKEGYVIVKPNGDVYIENIEDTVSLWRFTLTYII